MTTYYFFKLSLACSVLSSPLVLAQSPVEAGKDAEKQIPTNKAGLENAVETAKKAAEPIIPANDSPALAESRKRLFDLLAQKQNYQKLVAEGKIIPFQDLLKKLPEMHSTLVLAKSYVAQINDEEDAFKRKQLMETLVIAIQPIGHYLKDAANAPSDLRITESQRKELDQISAEKWQTLKSPDEKQFAMEWAGGSVKYTLLNVETALHLKAAPKAVVYLESTTGGQFPNGLSVIKLVANDQGHIFTKWVSHGDCAGHNSIHAVSASSSQGATLSIEVKQLQLELPVSLAAHLKALNKANQ